ncbi:hypothetical protein ACIBG8_48405 [Nonomuraea sp. NPDC050556]|uniref:hypothetical protein n=1 Tax=Nonomuraea sp. NPDC050556 TaxID=3364369 RepID=UPI00379A9D64
MKSAGLARRAAAFGASAAVLATMVAGLMSSPAQAATTSAGTVAKTAAATKSKPKVSVSTPKAADADYQGACPVKVDISAKIKVTLNGRTELAYRWLHGDGSKGKVQVVKLSGHGSKYVNVKETLSFGGNVKGWEAVQVLGPRKVTSKKGYFKVTCVDNEVDPNAPRTWVKAWAHPDEYVGPCDGRSGIDFTGVIKVNSPRWVRYRWILNGDVVDRGALKVWNTRRVGFEFEPRFSHRGWAVLEVLGRGGNESDRVRYSVWCKGEPSHETKVSVSTPTTGTNHNTCAVGANANISATGRGRVEWVWSVNGTDVAKGDTWFSEAGTKNVDLPEQALTGAAQNGGKVSITVKGPNNSDASSQSYAACNKPFSVSTSSISQAGVRTDQCVNTASSKRGPGVDFAATLTSTAAGTVSYHWVVNGVQDGPELTRTFDGAKSIPVTWGIGGTHDATVTKGSIQLVITSPNTASSSVLAYNESCPAA